MNINKFLLIFFFVCIIFTFPSLITVEAQQIKEKMFSIRPGTIPGAENFGIDNPVQVENPDQLLNIMREVVRQIYIIFFIITVVFIIFAAFNYLSSNETPEKLKKAHNQIIYAVIAIVIALLSVGFEVIIKNFLESENGNAYPVPVEEPIFDYFIPNDPGPYDFPNYEA